MPAYTARKIVQEGIPSLTLSVVISLASGSILNRGIELFVALPVLLALTPPLAGMAGSIGSIFSSRLSTALHLGLVKPRIEHSEVLTRNVFAVSTIAIVSSMYLSLVMYILSEFAGIRGLSLFEMAEVTVMAAILVSSITLIAALFISFLSYRRNLDPGSTTIPIVTAIGDLATSISIILAARVLGLV
ncbi:MAG: magnesium transporter [Candidatus Bathyarchaeota archaeon]|nr:MAG: magnesium transporter [Candidatus Bathyarchaeota archaeon]